MRVQLFRKSKENINVYGYLDEETIYIREDMKGIDYIETFIHEFIHWIIYKIIPTKLQRFFNCWFDMLDGFINSFNFNLVKSYYREYYEI